MVQKWPSTKGLKAEPATERNWKSDRWHQRPMKITKKQHNSPANKKNMATATQQNSLDWAKNNGKIPVTTLCQVSGTNIVADGSWMGSTQSLWMATSWYGSGLRYMILKWQESWVVPLVWGSNYYDCRQKVRLQEIPEWATLMVEGIDGINKLSVIGWIVTRTSWEDGRRWKKERRKKENE